MCRFVALAAHRMTTSFIASATLRLLSVHLILGLAGLRPCVIDAPAEPARVSSASFRARFGLGRLLAMGFICQ
ncbi:hypothetical protein DIE21_14635 [Burkholderia sp. Bp9140]|nr:hypothetical protein DIE21_14635 [Burkholderia sp. Bp9140]